MNARKLLFTAVSVSLCCASALAAAEDRPLTLREMANHMEAAYRGEVTAIQFDGGGDKRAHYHVVMRLANGMTHMDVDATTRDVLSREAAPRVPAGVLTLLEATAIATTTVPGKVVAATYDGSEDSAPHYDIDVRLPTNRIALLKIDAATREIGWRQPVIAPK